MIIGQRLRKGACGSPRGANLLVADALNAVQTLSTNRSGNRSGTKPLLRADSAFHGGHEVVGTALRKGAEVSITVRMDKKVKAAIATIPERGLDQDQVHRRDLRRGNRPVDLQGRSRRDRVTAFSSKKHQQVTGRLVVRRIPDLNPKAESGQATLFDTWRFHAFFTTTDPEVMDTVRGDKTHRGHALIEQVHADLKNSAIAHLPSASFSANSAWLVLAVIAFNLTRAAGTLAGTDMAKATTATVRRKLISAWPPDASPSTYSRLALGTRMVPTVHPSLPTTTRCRDLTTQPRPAQPENSGTP